MNLRPFMGIFAALVICVACGCDSTPATSNPLTKSSETPSEETKSIAVKVTGMMCPHSCLKDVKQLIEKKNDVVSIELTPQKDPDVIDNPIVLVKYRGKLHQAETTSAILAAGFEKVEYLESISQ